MEVQETSIQGLQLLIPRQFEDERGMFWETFRADMLHDAIGDRVEFVQDNLSISNRGVLRGMHYQRPPHAQGKLVRVVAGRIWDVSIDLRPNSKTYGQWYGCLLTGENGNQLWVPSGFAHGFLALDERNVVEYRCTAAYHPESEGSIRWDDPEVGIDWGAGQGWLPASGPVLSSKDWKAPLLRESPHPFT